MGHKHTRDELLAGALDVAFTGGLSQLTFGRVARHLGTSDRVIVYYFPSKDDLVTEVILALGRQLEAALVAAFSEPAANHIELARAAWPVLATPEVDRVFALFFEANGLATAGRYPYAELIPNLVAGWIDFAAEFVTGPTDQRRIDAETAVALLDGLLLLRLLTGAPAAERAARRLGISG